MFYYKLYSFRKQQITTYEFFSVTKYGIINIFQILSSSVLEIEK
jgi:hypothetical protein